ncbi:MAG TPA: GNAT family N-acetyltransferase [Candidatus Woesebacteria bacterium]|nr:GNAT family N-acetyltransferase [Candidatus Woesebacteria bacterium]
MDISVQYRQILPTDAVWIKNLLTQEWGSSIVVSRGTLHNTDKLPGIVAEIDSKPVGLLTYQITEDKCEIVTLNSIVQGKGVGTGLITKLKTIAKEKGCKKIWTITTNDNTDALLFYQKRGFRLVALYPNAIEQSRKLKPQIPQIGINGIPIRDEIELELNLPQ